MGQGGWASQAEAIAYLAHNGGLLAGTLGDCKLFSMGGGRGEAGNEAERIGKGKLWKTCRSHMELEMSSQGYSESSKGLQKKAGLLNGRGCWGQRLEAGTAARELL